MKTRLLDLTLCLLTIGFATSCTVSLPDAHGRGREPQPAVVVEQASPPAPFQPPPAVLPAAQAELDVAAVLPPPLPGEGANAPGPTPDIRMAAVGPALTETLDRALDRLAEESAENERFRETTAALEKALSEKEKTVQELAADLQECDLKIKEMEQSLENWKQDVLGFRNEMRDYEEAQIEVLQEIVLLLRGFKKEGGLP
jgi:hypothetical protein